MMNWHKKHIEIAFHVAFWLGHLLIRVFIARYHPANMIDTFLIELIELPIKIGASYAIIYWIVPNYLKREKYGHTVVSTLVLIFIVAVLKQAMDILVTFPLYNLTDEDWLNYFEQIKDNPLDLMFGFRRIIYIFPTVVAAVAIYFVYDWFLENKRNRQLEREKMTAELNYLKGQIHPHFLFNTLNNLYALTLKNSPDAPNVVMKLSKLLSYMLYEANEATVLLSKEIQQIEYLIALEKLRYGNRLESSFVVEGNTSEVRVAPLLFLPFVENAFKHGTSGAIKQSWVSTSIFADKNSITFQIENSLAPNTLETHRTNKGIGLQNVKRRLALLYPDQYELRISKEETFRVWLKLTTNSPIPKQTQVPLNQTQNHEMSHYR